MSLFQDVLICNQERTQRLNERIYTRNIPSHGPQMVFDPRPVRTRQVLFPMVDCYMPSSVPVIERSTYTQDQVFHPGSSAPFNGYQSGIDQESKLQNRFFPHQKATQSKYIPSSRSTLYEWNTVNNSSLTDYDLGHNPHDELYAPAEHHARETWGHPHPNPHKEIGNDLFYNHTKVQLKQVEGLHCTR